MNSSELAIPDETILEIADHTLVRGPDGLYRLSIAPGVSTNTEATIEGDELQGVITEVSGAVVEVQAESATVVRQPHEAFGSQIIVQGPTSGPRTIREQYARQVRAEPDMSASAYEPQLDRSAEGVAAMATVYVDNMRRRADKDGQHTVWIYDYSGISAKQFLDRVAAEEAQAKSLDSACPDILANTKLVIACYSDAQAQTLEASGMFRGRDVEYQCINPDRPDQLTLPDNTSLAIIPDRLSEQPAYPVARGLDDQIVVLQRATEIDRSPVVMVNEETGVAQAVSSEHVAEHGTLTDPAFRSQLMPQLHGKLHETDIFDGHITISALTESPLARQGSRVARFLRATSKDMRSGVLLNYSPHVDTLVQQVVKGVSPDGMVYIGDPLRDAKQEELEEAWIDPARSLEVPDRLPRHIVEAANVSRLALEVDPDATINFTHYGPGQYGYMVIDKNVERATYTLQTFHKSTVGQDPTITNLRARIRETEQTFMQTAGEEAAKQATMLMEQFSVLSSMHPPLRGDYRTIMRLTQLMNQKGFPHFGLKLANMAAELAPHYSAAHVEVAKSELAIAGELSNSDHEQIAEHQRNAYNALTVAQRLCPQNAEIYKVQLGYLKADLAAKTTAEGEPLQWGNATRFVDASLRYLEYASNLSSEETISTLLDICRGREIIWRMHEGIRDPAKTIIVEDLETGLLLADNHHIFREDIDRIIAADTYGEHGRIASLLAQDLDPEIYDKLMLPFLEGMDRLAYRDDDGSVTPREAWLDRIAGRTQRWHYAGTLYQDDYQTPPTTLLEWKVQMLSEQRRAEGVVHVAEVEPRLPVTSFRLGQVLNEAGMFEGRSGLSIALKDYPTHMLLAARSGGGKTRTLGLIAEHSVEMGLKVILQELGIKSELLQEMQRMQAKGIPFERIAPGDSSAIPVSLSFLHPPHPSIPIEAHLAAMTEAFTMVYGGYQPDSAIGPIITTALRLLYLANGHDVPPLIDTAADEWECTVPQDKPYIASLSEFEEYLLERSQGYQKGTDAANLPQFFRNRLESWKGGPLANGLFGNNIIDLDKLLQGSVNYYIDPSNIRNENEKLFWIAVLEAHIKNYLKYVLHESPNGQPRIAILTDEAQRLLRCYPEGDPRREITESYGYAQREQRTYGVARIGATQTATGINQESISQTGLVIAGPLKEHGDKVTILSSMGIDVTHPRFRDLYERFNRLSPGQALVWKAGMAEPIAVAIELTAQPDMSRLTARTVHPLPIQPNFYNSFTDHDVQQATRIAQEQSPNQASLRHLVRGMILSHITGKPMPIASADALRMYQSLPNNELVLRVMLDAEISRRSTAISSAYDPAELGRSVWSYIRSQLGRNPGTSNVMASSAFVLPQAVAAEERLRIGSRKLGVPQTFASYAWSLGIRALLGANDYRDRESGRNQMLPELHLDERQRAVELVSGLLAHPLYPAHGTRNQQILIKGVLGKDRRGASIVRDLHLLGTRPTSLEQVEGSYEARLYWRRLYHLGGTVLTGASITSPLITPFEAALFAAEDVDERQAMTAVAALPNL